MRCNTELVGYDNHSRAVWNMSRYELFAIHHLTPFYFSSDLIFTHFSHKKKKNPTSPACPLFFNIFPIIMKIDLDLILHAPFFFPLL